MTDHLKTLRELVAAGEKATPTRDATLMRYDHGGGRFYREVGRDRLLIADFYDEANREFYFAAANARPALAALLRVVEAAKATSVACKLACDAKGADNAVDGWYQAQVALDAALRDLAPEEAEDAE